jgi:hypothetical protein
MLVVVDVALMPAVIEPLAAVARPGDHLCLLALFGTQDTEIAEARGACDVLGLDVATVLTHEPDPVDALIAELDRRDHDLVVVLVDHFAASALGSIADAARALAETAQRGATLTFVVPPLLPPTHASRSPRDVSSFRRLEGNDLPKRPSIG